MRRRGRAVFAAMSLTVLGACDKVYFARMDIGAPLAARGSASSLTPAEHDKAVASFMAAAADLRLQCEPTAYSIIMDSYSTPPYRLTACRKKDQYTQVQLADSPTHVAIEVHQIAGLSEPPFFQECRSHISDQMRAAFPAERVTTRYPYRWGERDKASQ